MMSGCRRRAGSTERRPHAGAGGADPAPLHIRRAATLVGPASLPALCDATDEEEARHQESDKAHNIQPLGMLERPAGTSAELQVFARRARGCLMPQPPCVSGIHTPALAETHSRTARGCSFRPPPFPPCLSPLEGLRMWTSLCVEPVHEQGLASSGS